MTLKPAKKGPNNRIEGNVETKGRKKAYHWKSKPVQQLKEGNGVASAPQKAEPTELPPRKLCSE